MASTSDAAIIVSGGPSSSTALPLKKYDVFISFRGEDTRDNFTSHLHAALLQHQLETFIDYRLQKGDDVWPSLVQAIQDSTVSLVIFSQNYASSTWCLNELIEIMEQHNKKKDHVVVPVFFKIDPSHVRKQTHSYQTVFTKHEQDIKISSNMIHKWKETLFQAANLSGFDSRVYRTEHDLIEDIIKLVLHKLNHKKYLPNTKDMGHEIIRGESSDNPGRRSRLWDSGEVYDVLTSDKGTDAVESISLDMSQINDLHLHSHAFQNMPNLRLLAFDNSINFRIKKSNNYMCIPADLHLPINLVYLRWDNYPLKFLPSTSYWEKLVDLSLVNSNVEKLWNGKQSLRDLPENLVACHICLTDSMKLGHDASITLRTILPFPVFTNVTDLSITSSKLSQLPDNIWLLSSLEFLSLSGCNLISLPESIKYLPRLVRIDVRCNQRLRYVPALPRSIRFFHACDCVSLKTLLSSKTTEPSKNNPCYFLLHNCINLDHHAYDAVLKYAITRIEYRANSLSAITLENENNVKEKRGISGDICFFLPARSGKVGECFHYSSTQASLTIKLPPIFKCLGFVFYFIVSPFQSCFRNLHFGCECFLEKSSGEMVEVTSFFVLEPLLLELYLLPLKLISDHVLLWYDAQCCNGIMKAIKEIKAVNDGNTTDYLTFKFFAHTEYNEELVIPECGVRWIYPSEDQIAEEGRGCKCKRSRDIYELHNGTIVRNGATKCESDEPDKMVPLSKKLKQCVFGTPSNLDRKEVEDLRLLLELHLHIGEDLK
ncbi:hypothetical protein RIF29_13618 [Crotalaria pallida]|uniref:TIR domain-containing protein n=1 Tax=Crotalaria pallida TaxID=3830 RepID=A0AAN9IPI5_CROPI